MKNKEKIDGEIFKNTKERAEEFYKKINKVYCPYLKTTVNFNSKGLTHIKIKSWNKPRLRKDQYIRLKFIHLAPLIIKMSHTLQEIQNLENLEKIRISGEWKEKRKKVIYFAFIAIIDKIRLKIIIKKIEDNNPYFWSIIPFWKKRNNTILRQTKKVFREGDLRYD